ncbi:MAG: peptidoglycan-binding protein [Tessaracoccus sp.]|uniref:peptidoglycan-binding domain-containing protein n=1 Tax=Tessaracoccus sp. TaxID=1971211 RepID=UPI001ED0A807|nr:peptidoglycan-binding protein [Tessaracoccus sp.]MBK7820499.1 peptidoglycan-binding protein [Tessaracoccus sp.]
MTAESIQGAAARMRRAVVALALATVLLLAGSVVFGSEEAHAAASGCVAKVYRKGASGKCVTYIQRILNASNVTKDIDDDGEYGPATKKAVEALQRNRGIKDDGVVGPHTWKNLCAVTQSGAATSKSKAGCARIKGWTRAFTHKDLRISACNNGTHNELRFELGSSKKAISHVAVGSMSFGVKLGTKRKNAHVKAAWGDAKWPVQILPETGKLEYVHIGWVTLKRAKYAPCK